MMDEQIYRDADRIDLSPLDPHVDPSHFEQLVREVRRAATPELIRRQMSLTPWGQIARWRRPILSASGLLALAAAVVIVVARPPAEAPPTDVEALGVPDRVARWVQAAEKPSPAELVGLERSEP